MNLHYTLHSGKNSKINYYARNYLRLATPKALLRHRLPALLEQAAQRDDYDYILSRVDYYNRLTPTTPVDLQQWNEHAVMLANQPMTRQKVYFFDSYEYARYFPQDKRWVLLPGDVNYIASLPSIVKSRPIAGDNACSVLLNMDKVRHFIFVNDRKTFLQKKPMAIFRGKVQRKPIRLDFMQKFFGNPMFNIGAIEQDPPEWHSEKLTIGDHLEYKFVISLEGNDVASNLKWVMSSNSIAVMPEPTCETWFMEGCLKPDYHYIRVRSDFADLEERLHYYIDHPDEAQAIINHAHDYVDQFRDARRERLISLLVLQKYFQFTDNLHE